MKLLTIAATCMAVVFAGEAAMAQTRCYDPFQAGATYRYNTAAGYNLIGDILTAPCNNVSSIEVGFVATAAGTYNIGFDVWGTNCLGTPAATPIAITIPAGGTFPSAWRITLTPSTPIPSVQFFSVKSASQSFVPAFTLNTPALANGVNGVSVDLNPTNGTLLPNFPGCGGNEWYSLGDQTNQLVALITTPSPLAALHGPFVNDYTVDVERDNAPVQLAPALAEIKPQ